MCAPSSPAPFTWRACSGLLQTAVWVTAHSCGASRGGGSVLCRVPCTHWAQGRRGASVLGKLRQQAPARLGSGVHGLLPSKMAPNNPRLHRLWDILLLPAQLRKTDSDLSVLVSASRVAVNCTALRGSHASSEPISESRAWGSSDWPA